MTPSVVFFDGSTATTHLRVGSQVQGVTDEEILLVFNRTVATQIRNRDELGEYVAVEIPPGSPQVERFPGTTSEWTPRGGVP
jgi:sorbitol-specific phosphotransferase system component IIA